MVSTLRYTISRVQYLTVKIEKENTRPLNSFQVITKPYLVFFNLEKCIDPLVPINGCPTPQVCVEKCPDSIFIYDQSACSASTLESIKSKLICNRDVLLPNIDSCSVLDHMIKTDRCATWYLPSQSCK